MFLAQLSNLDFICIRYQVQVKVIHYRIHNIINRRRTTSLVIQKNDKSKNGHNKININTYVILWYKGSEQEREREKKQSGTHSIENILR